MNHHHRHRRIEFILLNILENDYISLLNWENNSLKRFPVLFHLFILLISAFALFLLVVFTFALALISNA